MRRAIVIVLDGVGAGEAPDAAEFGDLDHPSSLLHAWEVAGGIDAPLLNDAGFFAVAGIPSTPSFLVGSEKLASSACRLQPLSKGGKDSVTGHWEMMGIVLPKPFPTYPNGFPISLIKEFERRIGTQTLANRPASGTAIIAELGQSHFDTGFPIVYTSADSVFQIACHEEIVPIEKLYEYCRIARELCVEPNNVQRVIARPFVGDATNGFTRTEKRKDFPVNPPHNLIDEIGDVFGIGVVTELFNGRGFRSVRRTQSNAEHEVMLKDALASNARFIFANFEDTDMLFGHRNDPTGYARCLSEFDKTLSDVLTQLGEDDLLIVTSDHGNDPTTASTDHSREFVPMIAIGRQIAKGIQPDISGFAHVGKLVKSHLGL